jgi:hypothetical protein
VECIHSVGKIKPEDDLYIALRAEDILTASQAMALIAEALQLAWETVCFSGNTHPCPDLMTISHQEFQQSYFAKVLQSQRSGLKLPQRNKDWLKEPVSFPNLLLVGYHRSHQHRSIINLHKVCKMNYYISYFYVARHSLKFPSTGSKQILNFLSRVVKKNKNLKKEKPCFYDTLNNTFPTSLARN